MLLIRYLQDVYLKETNFICDMKLLEKIEVNNKTHKTTLIYKKD